MQFLIEYNFGPQYSDANESLRQAHLAYRMGLPSLRLAAQLRSSDDRMVGSVLILEAEGRDEAEAIAHNDPYVGAGYYENIVVRPCLVRFCDLAAGIP